MVVQIALFILLMISFIRGDKDLMLLTFIGMTIHWELYKIRNVLEERK